MRTTLMIVAALIWAGSLSAQARAPAGLTDTVLERSLRQIAATSGGVLGVSALHLESGKRVSVRGDERFPMMSVYKVPIAIAVVTRAEWGELKLSDSVQLRPADLHPGRSPLAQRYPAAGVKLSIEQLLEAMVVESDNSAGDVLLRIAGGPEMVTGRLREIGVRDILVSRSEAQIALDYYGVTSAPAESTWTLAALERLLRESPPAQRTKGLAWYLEDERDTATPNAMTDLLAALYAGQAVRKENAIWLLQLMASTPTGPQRLKGKLPKGTEVAHKTGTSGTIDGVTGAVNDVGIITLPNNDGHIAISVFVKGAAGERAAEAAIAGVAERIYAAWRE